jgi:hypothetical protein
MLFPIKFNANNKHLSKGREVLALTLLGEVSRIGDRYSEKALSDRGNMIFIPLYPESTSERRTRFFNSCINTIIKARDTLSPKTSQRNSPKSESKIFSRATFVYCGS